MGKTLVVTEKADAAAVLAKALGGFHKEKSWLESDSIIIAPAQGHLVELHSPEMASTGRTLDTLPVLPLQFELRVIGGGSNLRYESLFSAIKHLADRPDVDRIVNACDAGREGELIFRLIMELASCTKPMFRMWCQSFTAEAIRESYRSAKPARDYDNLGAAARARMEGDCLVGINGSRGATILYGLMTAKNEIQAVGRVQTPTGGLVVERELEIKNFKPRDYWEIHASINVARDGAPQGNYVGRWFHQKAPSTEDTEQSEDSIYRIFDAEKAAAIAAKCKGKPPSSVKDDSKLTHKAPPRLFDLIALQREASRRFGYAPTKTEGFAQKLYEKGVLTYPRTDSTYLPDDYLPKVKLAMEIHGVNAYKPHVDRIFTNGWLKQDKNIFNSKEVTDHWAIVPDENPPKDLPAEEMNIYDMVVRRFLAVFHPSAQFSVTTRITTIEGELFKTTGRVLLSEGWQVVYDKSSLDEVDGDKSKKSPPLVGYASGDAVTLASLDLKPLKTRPPGRYNFDTLLAAMAGAGRHVEDAEIRKALMERGLGTPSSRGKIIDGLLSNRDGKGQPKEPYLRQDGTSLTPTKKLIGLIMFLRENGLQELTSAEMTGGWEFKLRKIEAGAFDPVVFANEIKKFTTLIIQQIREKSSTIEVKVLDSACPKCGGDVAIGPRLYECRAACGFKIWKEVAGRILKPAEASTLLRDGQVMNLTGFVSQAKKRFTACLKFNAEWGLEFFFDETLDAKDAKGELVHCPKCTKLMRRIKGSNGYFWGCSDRECGCLLQDDSGMPVMPVPPRPCPECGSEMNRKLGKFGFFWGCSNKEHCGLYLEDKGGEPVTEGRGSAACPKCSRQMRRIKGQHGFFWGCSDRECKTTCQDLDGHPVMPVPSQPCPKCNGPMNRHLGRSGFYWTCDRKDECGHSMDDKDGLPVAREEKAVSCPSCGKPMRRRKRRSDGGFFWGCTGYSKDVQDCCKTVMEDKDGNPVFESQEPKRPPASPAAATPPEPAKPTYVFDHERTFQ